MKEWRAALDIARRIDEGGQTGPALISIGGGFYRSGKLDSARKYAERGVSIATAAGDMRTAGNGLGLLATIHRDLGHTESAVRLYKRARPVRARAGDTRGLAADENNLAMIARDAGDLATASASFERALSLNAQLKRYGPAALNLSNLAGISTDRGNLIRADSLYRKARTFARLAGVNADLGFIAADHARLETRMGDYEAAALDFGTAARLLASSGNRDEASSVRAELASLFGAIGNLRSAQQVLDMAEETARAGVLAPATLADLEMTRADLATRVEAYERAEDASQNAERLYLASGDTLQASHATELRALIRFLRGNSTGALDLASAALATQISQRDSRGTAMTRLLLANIQHWLGHKTFRQTVDLAIQTFRADGDRVAESAANVLLGDLTLDSDPITAERSYRRGLDLLGRGKSPEVEWQLRSGLARLLSGRKSFDSAATQYERSIALIESMASAVPSLSQRSGFLRDKWASYVDLANVELLRGRVESALATSERMRARQLLETLGRERIGSVSSNESSAALRMTLNGDEAVLEYLLGDSSSSVFIITRDTVRVVELRAGRRTLAPVVELARRAMERPATGSATRWRPPLARLYRELIEPIERAGYLANTRSLIIVPHAELNYASFAAFVPAAGSFLLDRYDISYSPSATALVGLAARRSMRGGVSVFAPHSRKLPGSMRELSAIREIYGGDARAEVGSQATSGSLTRHIAGSAVLHFATFGFVNRQNPLLSFVSLASAPRSSPELRVSEILQLSLSGQLVVLSACETGVGAGRNQEIPPGEEWIGLMQAFLQRGASSVIASLWPVDDAATSVLMRRFHMRVRQGHSASGALAIAQRELQADPRTSDPFFWAPFTTNGNHRWVLTRPGARLAQVAVGVSGRQ